MKLNNETHEKRRALNVIWNASNDYSFNPEFIVYDEDANADIYWNFILGSVHKYFDYSLLEKEFGYLRKSGQENYVLYENLLWIGLENSTFKKTESCRPAITNLRKQYARSILKKKNPDNIFDEINMAHFRRALGQNPEVKGFVLNVLNDVEFDEFITTEQIIWRMNKILRTYFKFVGPVNKELYLDKFRNNLKFLNFGGKENLKGNKSILNYFYMGRSNISGEIKYKILKERRSFILNLRKYMEKKENYERKYIEESFGASIFEEAHTIGLEKALCTGNHKNCHLHFTKGEFKNFEKHNIYKITNLEQREKNKKYYYENYAIINTNVIRLTNKIKNILQFNHETSHIKANAGKIASEKIWRNVHLGDDKIFIKDIKDDTGNVSVDIMLDASASQINRQEIIAAQGYIIAESLTRCNIPVRVYSYCNIRDYTVINVFRDYDNTYGNKNIFNYNAVGFNRDGLAARVSLSMIKNSSCDNRILIILSDGKPNDIKRIHAEGFFSPKKDYAGDDGVHDAAVEIRKAHKEGVMVLAVFTGEDEELPAAKKIYGSNLVRIKSTEQFADMVGNLMSNILNK